MNVGNIEINIDIQNMNFNNIDINIDIQNMNYVNIEINIDIHFNFNSQPCVLLYTISI